MTSVVSVVLAGVLLMTWPYQAAAQSAVPAWTFANESSWIESEIQQALAAMPGAKERRLPRHEPFVRDAQRYIWDPEAYLSLLRPTTTRSATHEASELVSQLTTPTIDALQNANVASSWRMRANPEAPEPHEDAALVLGVIAFRESAGRFSDTRPALARMTAHLAMARALDSMPGRRNRRAAELLLAVLVGRQQDALQQIDAWTSESPGDGVPRFLNAMRLRVTGNWRAVEQPASLSLLERMAYTQALMDRVGPNAVLNFLDGSHPERTADWTRILAGGPVTVESGYRLADRAIEAELTEAWRVWPDAGRDRPDSAFADALTASPDDDQPAPEYRVVDWPFWRAAYQRQIASAVAIIVWHSGYMLGSPKTPELTVRYDRAFGAMPLYPLVRRHYAVERAHYDAAMFSARRLLNEHPEWITPANWTLLAERWSDAPVPAAIAPSGAWFAPLVPAGTAYDAAGRIVGVRGALLARPHELRAIHALAPFDRSVLLRLVTFDLGDHPAPDRLEALLGEAAGYDRALLRSIATAQWDDIDAFARTGDRLCAISADDCDWIAEGLLDSGRVAEATTRYQRFALDARDRIGVTNKIRWLVMHLLDTGHLDEARTLADEGEEVFSHAGLVNKALFLEETGSLDQAEAVLRQGLDRYKRDANHLAAFYLRQMDTAAGRRKYEAVALPLIAKVFSSGLEPYDPSGDDAAPRRGACVKRSGRMGVRLGLLVNDVIVAVNGVRVDDAAQFAMLRDSTKGREFSARVYRGDHYVEVHALPRFGWVNAEFADYQAPAIVGVDAQGPIRLPWNR